MDVTVEEKTIVVRALNENEQSEETHQMQYIFAYTNINRIA